MKTKKIKIKNSQNKVFSLITEVIEKKKTVNKFIKEGKDLKNLDERGIKLRMPV